MPDMSGIDTLERGRAAFDARRWVDAFALLSEADKLAPLAIDDIERLSRSASILGDDATAFELLARGYEKCLAEGQPLRASRAAFWHGYRLAARGEFAQGTAWLARSEELAVQHGDCVERGYLLLPKIRQRLAQNDYPAARDLAHEAASVGRRFSDPDLAALGLELEGRSLLLLGDVDTGLACMDRAMLAATGADSTELVKGLVYCSVIAGCQLVYAVDHAREWTAVLARWCEGQPQIGLFSGTCRVHRAELMQLGGDWNEALEEIGGFAEGRLEGNIDNAAAAYQQAEIHRPRGELAEAELAYTRAAEHGGDTQPGLALLRLAEGNAAAAASGLNRALTTASGALRRARYLPAYVEIMLATGALDLAQSAAQELVSTAQQFATPVLRAVSAHAVGSVALASGEPAKALPHLRAAFAIWQELEAPYLAARLRVEIAAAFEALGDLEGASLERDAARKIFRKLGARPALDALAAPKSGPAILSRRELEVLRLAAAGSTNKQIAAVLELSSRTVDRHVSNILMKLNVPSRAAATAYAYEHGLVRTGQVTG